MHDDLSYIAYPLPEDIERLVYAGYFAKANKIIVDRLGDAKVPECLKKRLVFEQHIIEALIAEYPYTKEEMFTRLQTAVTDFTREEFETLTDDGTLDWIFVEGKPYYKDDCEACLRKVHPEMNARFTNQDAIREKYDHFKALDAMIDGMKQKGHAHLRCRIREMITIDAEAQQPGKRIRVYMPLPVKTAQSVPGEVIAPEAVHIAPETHPQRTAFFDTIYQKDMSFTAEFSVDIDAPYVDPNPENVSEEQPHFSTEEVLPQIRFTPFIRALCAELKGNETNPLVIARRFYDYVTTNTCYRYVPPYYTKVNIPEYFGAGRRGDCGMHALLFITLCRCAGIPAEWQAGWYARPGDMGCHDWARFYVAPYGWMFADGSFGGAAYREGQFDRWNFYFGNLEPWRMVANSDIQATFDPPCEKLRFDPYDNQSGEVLYDDRMLSHAEFTIHRELISCEEVDD